MKTLKERLEDHAERTTMIRGDQGYGRKPAKSMIAALAEVAAVAVHTHDAHTGVTTINTIHDPNPVIDDNRRRMLSGHDGYTPSRDFKHVAQIPDGILVQWYKQGINYLRDEDWPKIAAMLDDSSWWFLRTSPGRVSRRPVRTYVTPREKR